MIGWRKELVTRLASYLTDAPSDGSEYVRKDAGWEVVSAGAHSHTNKAELDVLTDGDHDVNTSNPHSVTSKDTLPAQAGKSGEYLTTDGTDASWAAAGGSGISEYMYPVWAEENAAIVADGYEWAYGNGANTPADGGLTVYVPSGWTCTVVAMSLRIGSGTATVQLVLNGTPQGASCNVAIASGQGGTEDGFTPVAISDGDYINFRTQAAASTTGPCVVTAWLKMAETA